MCLCFSSRGGSVAGKGKVPLVAAEDVVGVHGQAGGKPGEGTGRIPLVEEKPEAGGSGKAVAGSQGVA
jgi:hypothetical protein